MPTAVGLHTTPLGEAAKLSWGTNLAMLIWFLRRSDQGEINVLRAELRLRSWLQAEHHARRFLAI
jgi:hypothetical protein